MSWPNRLKLLLVYALLVSLPAGAMGLLHARAQGRVSSTRRASATQLLRQGRIDAAMRKDPSLREAIIRSVAEQKGIDADQLRWTQRDGASRQPALEVVAPRK